MKTHVLVLLSFFLLILGCVDRSAGPVTHADFPIRFHDKQSDFTFYLPSSWQGYSVLTNKWTGQTYSKEKDETTVVSQGPMVVLRHPGWNTNDVYLDIPLWIFTRSQWDARHRGDFIVEVGGYTEELWHNKEFVVGIWNRWARDDGLKDFKETQAIVARNTTRSPLYPKP